MTAPTGRHVAIIGAGAVGVISAIEALRDGHRVTLIDPGEPGGTQAASYGNAGWLSSHSVIPPAEPGIWKKVPSYLMDPLGPLAVRWSYLPKALPWLIRYLLSGWTEARVEKTARALRDLLKDAPALHKKLADEAGVGNLRSSGAACCISFRRAPPLTISAGASASASASNGWNFPPTRCASASPILIRAILLACWWRKPGIAAIPAAMSPRLPTTQLPTAPNWYAPGNRARLHRRQARCGRDRNRRDRLRRGRDRRRRAIEASCRFRRRLPAAGNRARLSRGDRASGIGTAHVDDGIRRQDGGQLDRQRPARCRHRRNRRPGSRPNWKRAEILRDHLLGMFPKLPKSIPPSRIKTWFGHRPSDGRPCIGFARASREIVYAFGHGHVGLVGSARTGRLVAQLLSGREPEIPLAPFAPTRFL